MHLEFMAYEIAECERVCQFSISGRSSLSGVQQPVLKRMDSNEDKTKVP